MLCSFFDVHISKLMCLYVYVFMNVYILNVYSCSFTVLTGWPETTTCQSNIDNICFDIGLNWMAPNAIGLSPLEAPQECEDGRQLRDPRRGHRLPGGHNMTSKRQFLDWVIPKMFGVSFPTILG